MEKLLIRYYKGYTTAEETVEVENSSWNRIQCGSVSGKWGDINNRSFWQGQLFLHAECKRGDLMILPGRKIVYDIVQEGVVLKKADIDVETSWKDGGCFLETLHLRIS